MNKVYFYLFFSLCFSSAFAQKSLTKSRQSSFYTYIYPVNDETVKSLYQGKKLDENILQTPIDSFLTTGGKVPNLGQGNYLKVLVEKNQLHYSLIENRSAYLKLLDNRKDLQFILTDILGKEIKNAEVSLNGKSLNYDSKAGLWYTKYPKKDENLIRVKYQDLANYTTISFDKDKHKKTSTLTNWVKKYSVKFIYAPMVRLFYKLKNESPPYKYQRYKNRKQQKDNFSGYMVFSKPIYKPLDTVKFKAFILKGKSHKPVDEVLSVRLLTDDGRKSLGEIKPTNKGAYDFTFVLHDSLKLKLDRNYTFQLYHNDKVYRAGSFRYEEYELKSISFAMRSDKEEHSRKQPQSIYFKATDENGLNVMDGRVEVTVSSNQVRGFKNEKVFVPDVLWKHQLKLDPLGETKLVLPDSIFPDADIKYSVLGVFLNSNNESKDAYKVFDFIAEEKNDLNFEAKGDSLLISFKNVANNIPQLVKIAAINANADTLESFKLRLPAVVKINPYAEEYKVEADSLLDWFEIKDITADLKVYTRRTADSLFVTVDNPRKIPFWYVIFKGNKIVDRGQAVDLNYQSAYNQKDIITFQYNYVWGDEPVSQQVTANFSEKALLLDVKQPLVVAPGEKTEIEVTVKDTKGKAVEDVDVTAYSFTSKFRYTSPYVPYLGKSWSQRKQNISLESDEGFNKRTLPLNWLRWGKELGLDSIAYFRFTHPNPVYRYEETASQDITQIAPFVIEKGEILPVEILYLNNKPVFFSQAEQMERYSFKVEPGIVYIKFRLKNKSVIADSVLVPKGKKLIVSFNVDNVMNKNISVIKEPLILSAAEASVLNNYMIRLANTFSPRFASIAMPDKVFLLQPKHTDSWLNSKPRLVGPLSYNLAEYRLMNDNPVSFVVEPNYSYTFKPGLIKQQSLPDKYAFSTMLSSTKTPSFLDRVLTNKEIDTLWQEYLDLRSHTTTLFHNAYNLNKGTGKLQIQIKKTAKDKTLPLIKNILVYNYDNPDFLNIYPGRQTVLGDFLPGNYRIMFLLKGDSYMLLENVIIKANGTNLLEVSLDKIVEKDSVSSKISSFITARSITLDNEVKPGVEFIKETFNDQFVNNNTYTNTMSGYIFGKDDAEPLVGVSIQIKGTSFRTNSDIYGGFTINVPKKGKLVLRYIGFESIELDINNLSDNKVYLKASSNELSEVVVVGYGTQKKSSIERSLQGMVGGVSVKKNLSVSNIYIRGSSSISGDQTPLYIVDGIPMEMALTHLKPEEIADMSVLKNDAAIAIYGVRGANGVIIINTQKAKEKAAQEIAKNAESGSLSIRKKFSDAAFWQPQLRTNAEGKVKFNVLFPDDITNWRTFFIAMNGKEQSGYYESNIKSFKPLSAAFVSPIFAIKGDTFSPIGKVSNYTSEIASVKRAFIFNGESLISGNVSVKNSHIDTFKIIANGLDSLKFQYSIQKESGYSDGEERIIPVFNAGVLETRGTFNSLEKDTTMSLSFDPKLGEVTFRAEASVFPVLLAESDHLRNYPYLCNEQLASKLKALLSEKRIKAYLNEPFENEKTIKQLIKKLDEGRRNDGTWGWWKNSEAELWISRHVIEALLDAEKSGYTINLNKQALTSYLIYQLSHYNGMNKLEALLLLKRIDAKVDYKTSLDLYEKEIKSSKSKVILHEKLKLWKLKQEIGLTVSSDSLLPYKHATMFGNMYFGNHNYEFFDNSIQNTLLAYAIIKAESKHPEWLTKIRNFLLEQRKDGNWRNTYESSLILETLLPELLKEGVKPKPAKLTLATDKKEVINNFPYTTILNPEVKLQVQKEGDFPVYITAYQQFWNAEPERVSKDFSVDTWFENKAGSKIEFLKGGEAVVLKVKIKAVADFVMVEIPIPAGCSYDEKEQSYWGQEVHREYFKDKVTIFCRKLKEGNYTFSVKLMPRYDGNYILNPAKVEMMYFPVFYGREKIKKVRIGE
jgi:TonB-dependent SusC/RagA subfamily outer membrane receptor